MLPETKMVTIIQIQQIQLLVCDNENKVESIFTYKFQIHVKHIFIDIMDPICRPVF